MKKVRLDPHSGQEHAPTPPKPKVKSPVRAKKRVPVQEFRQLAEIVQRP
jgi:hypothetical protein